MYLLNKDSCKNVFFNCKIICSYSTDKKVLLCLHFYCFLCEFNKFLDWGVFTLHASNVGLIYRSHKDNTDEKNNQNAKFAINAGNRQPKERRKLSLSIRTRKVQPQRCKSCARHGDFTMGSKATRVFTRKLDFPGRVVTQVPKCHREGTNELAVSLRRQRRR